MGGMEGTSDVPTIDIEDRFVEVAAGRVFTRTWAPIGGRADTPLILLHGSLGCVAVWHDFPQKLARRLGWPVIGYDRLGSGRSSALSELPSIGFIRKEAETVFPALLRSLGIARYALFGHSVGGAMALLIAASQPEHCQAVVSESAQPYVEERTREEIRRVAAEFEQPEQMARLVRSHGDKADWVLRAWRDVWLAPTFGSLSLEADLARIRCPVLVIHGDRDEYGSVKFPRLIASIVTGRSELAILPGVGHVPHRERPDEVAGLVERFLEGALGTAIKGA